MKIVIVNYDSGNIQSLKHALQEIGCEYVYSNQKSDILNADRLILPGVGAFARCVERFRKYQLDNILNEYIESGKYILGICIGMQILFESSDEFNRTDGLGIIRGHVKKLPLFSKSGDLMKVPHTNWSPIYLPNAKSWANTPLCSIHENESVYFVHSYYAVPSNKDEAIAYTSFGGHEICVAVRKDNVFGCQFHPEKSGKIGLSILDNFLSIK